MVWILDFIEQNEDAWKQLDGGDVTAFKRFRDGRLWPIEKDEWGNDQFWTRVCRTGRVRETVVSTAPVFIKKGVEQPDTATGANEGKAAELPEPTDPKSSAVRPKRAGRKKGSGSYDSEDAPLLKEIEALVENEKPMALWNAALSVADRAPGKTIISRAKRLVIKYKERPDLR